MMEVRLRCLFVLSVCCLLVACSEEPKKEYKEPDWDRLTRADRDRPTAVAAPSEASATAPPAAPATTGNIPPRIVEVTTTVEKSVRQGAITVHAVAADADGDAVEFRYQWLINGEESPFLQESILAANSYAKGDQVQVRVIPFDGSEEGRPYLSPPLQRPNVPPVITSQPPMSFQAQVYTYQIEASDPDDSNELSYSLNDPPAGMTVSDGGLISWPLADVEPGDYKIAIVVTDPDGDKATQEFSLALEKTRSAE